ncbi:MAG: FkbM family methyltransferase [Pirellula sp.]
MARETSAGAPSRSLVQRMKRLYRYYFKNPPKVKKSIRLNVERHGTEYGGWNIVADSLSIESIVYSFGIGEDVSFDLSLIKKYGCPVIGFDPTPRVGQWLKDHVDEPRFRFFPIGLSNTDGTLTFYEPLDPNFVSHTSVDLGNSTKLDVPCKRLKSCMEMLGHAKIDLLKMDIEGFEYDVVADIIRDGLRPTQLLIEFHHFFPQYGRETTEQSIQTLEKYGYRLFDISDSFCEYSFLWKG